MKHVLIAMTLFAAAAANAQLKPGDADNGKKIFLRNGCYQCHGTVGQGGSGGARLAQTKLTQAGLTAYVRNPRPGGMPRIEPRSCPTRNWPTSTPTSNRYPSRSSRRIFRS